MAFKDFPDQGQGIELLQRSLERGRLAHAYLFTGHQLEELEGIAQTLAKTLNCRNPVRGENGVAVDCCDECVNCRKIGSGNHADVHWVRPESKSRIVSVEQMRELMQEIYLKPTEADYKVAVIVAADRLNTQGANAFLKTLEEPPAKSVLILITTEPQRLLETILSRCLRLNFAGDGPRPLSPEQMAWLENFSEMASAERKSLLGRYRLMDVLVQKLTAMKTAIEETLAARSPLERYDDIEKDLRERWEEELKAAIEAEYRRQRADLLAMVQRWLRDVWLQTLAISGGENANSTQSRELLNFPNLTGGEKVARRITTAQAMENLQVIEGTQRLLHTNVQEALALEVGILKLHL
ncbi:MAG TPA: DNA polymerase III subunit [Verrucomicrobiae bacterium]|nr:DNA polymerase III subunit [Verrucomicrobiae bacterium]